MELKTIIAVVLVLFILGGLIFLDLCRMEENKFPLSQWQDSVRYLTGIEKDFTSEKQIRDFILNEMEVN